MFGKIYLISGVILEFNVPLEFFCARGFWEKKDQVKWSVHSVWGKPGPYDLH